MAMAAGTNQAFAKCCVGVVLMLVLCCVQASEDSKGFEPAASEPAAEDGDLGLPGGAASSHGRSSRSGTTLGVVLLLVAAVAVVFLRKKKTEIWPDLVASPTVFNKVLKKMGVSRFTFVDVFDPESIPSSAVAVVVLQRFDPEHGAQHSAKSVPSSGSQPSKETPPPCSFLPQLAMGSCGTLSIVNSLSLSTLAQARGVAAEVPLWQGILQSKGRIPTNSTADKVQAAVKECHYHAAGRPLSVEFAKHPPRPDIDVIRNHFVAFLPTTSADIFEIDPMKPEPLWRGPWGKGADTSTLPQALSAALRRKYHGQTADALGCLLALVPC